MANIVIVTALGTPAAPLNAGNTGSTVYADPAAPAPMLADDIDPNTGELLSVFTSPHPVDAMARDAVIADRDSGLAIAGVGNTIHEIENLIPGESERDLADAARVALASLVERRLIDAVAVSTVEGDTSDTQIRYRNRLTRRNGPSIPLQPLANLS